MTAVAAANGRSGRVPLFLRGTGKLKRHNHIEQIKLAGWVSTSARIGFKSWLLSTRPDRAAAVEARLANMPPCLIGVKAREVCGGASGT
jgi:hypothetical protein